MLMDGKQSLVVGNWKAEGNIALVDEFCRYQEAFQLDSVMAGFAVPALYSQRMMQAIPHCLHGLQTISHMPNGAFTGEITAEMASSSGLTFVLIGHSERRQWFFEELSLSEKIRQALQYELLPVCCIGESLAVRRSGKAATESFLESQLLPVMESVDGKQFVVAYEPIWAIGTGETASPRQVAEVHRFIKEFFERRVGYVPRVLYGGSVKPQNALELAEIDMVDGFLVGGASLRPETFVEIIQSTARAKT